MLYEVITAKGYRMIESCIDQLPGGKILYRRNDEDHDLEFCHSPIYLGITLYYIKGDYSTRITIRDTDDNYVRGCYKDQAEYINLENYKKELDKMFESQSVVHSLVHSVRITSYNVCYTKLLRHTQIQ